MKKSLVIFAAALAMGACTKEAPETVSKPVEGSTVFSGCFDPATKISVGDKEGDIYKALWDADDVLTVVDAQTSSALGTAILTSGAGENLAEFTMPGTIADGTQVILKYGTEGIATEQSQTGAGASKLSQWTGASSEAVTVSGGKAGFTLVHSAAIVKVSVSSSALSGATVGAVILRSCGAVLSGENSDYVRVTLGTPVTLGSTAAEIWLTAIPADLSGKEVDVAFEITKDGETYTLPVGFAGKALRSNAVNSFTVSALSDAKCVKWYAPHDTRLMAGAGYAYGDANCYLIQYKEATYSGATLSADSSIPSSVVIDYRARGNFLKVKNPAGSTFGWVKMGNNTYNIQSSGYVTTNSNSFSLSDNSSTFELTVTNTGALAGAPILTMTNGGKVIWAWTLWNISADGTRFAATDVGSYKLANMDIGQNTTEFETWAKSSTKPDLNFRCSYYYQWGRPTPIYWSSWPTNNIYTASGYATYVVQGPLSHEDALANPGCLIMNTEKAAGTSSADASAARIGAWSSSNEGDLWGGSKTSNTDAGQKSNYDPCPKGWRVADRAVYTYINGGALGTASTSVAGAYYNEFALTPGNKFPISGRYEDYIASNGRIATQGMAAAGTSTSQGQRWSNYSGADGANQATAFYNATTSKSVSTFNKACSMPVRCMVDADNR